MHHSGLLVYILSTVAIALIIDVVLVLEGILFMMILKVNYAVGSYITK